MTQLPPDPLNDLTDPTISDAAPNDGPPAVPESPVPDPTPTGPSQDDFDAMKTDLANYQKMADALAAQDIKTHADLTRRLANPSSDDLRTIFQEALGKETQPTPVPVPANEPLNESTIAAMIAKALGEQQASQASERYNEAASAEASLRARIFNDPRFDAIMQKATYEQAFKGEKGGAAKALAILGDNLLYERGTKNPDGVYRPVTDPAAVSEVTNTLATLLSELKAVTLHELSAEPTAPSAPDAPAGGDVDTLLIDLVDSYGEIGGMGNEGSDKEDAAIRATYEGAYRAALAQGGNLPASQSV